MSRSAGRVLIIPKGDYDPSYQYEMLDSCEYNNASYICRQTSKGNLPTNKDYWQPLAGGFMLIDGSNGENVLFIGNALPDEFSVSISKNAGESQSLTIIVAANAENAMFTESLKILIGSPSVYYLDGATKIYVIIDSVAGPDIDVSDVITIGAHLRQDDSAAISIASTTLYADSYADSTHKNATVIGTGYAENDGSFAGGVYSAAANGGLAHGYYCAASGNNSLSVGARNYSKGNRSVTLGMQNIASGINSFAAGIGTRAGYNNQFVCGQYNNNANNNLFEIGIGTSESSKVNGFAVDLNGYIKQSDNGNERFKFAKVGGVLGFYTGNDVFHPYEEPPKYFTQSNVVLSTSQDTTVTFTDDAIGTDSMIDVYTDTFGINPSDISIGGANNHTCTLIFAKVSSAITIAVRIVIKNV